MADAEVDAVVIATDTNTHEGVIEVVIFARKRAREKLEI